ncbi:major tail protein [Listeria seeligeri]|uniref:major tail protein n=1 Tax=Listeria seeligeri TaxID=1640 RepID=UPI0022EBA6EC|nr:major tail protein [Listeria seeligeri]
MAETAKKVAKIGLDQFQYAKLGDDDKVTSKDDVKPIPGLQSAKLTVTMDSEPIYADNGPYLIMNSGITELGLEVGIVNISSDDRVALLGIELENGVEVYKKDITPPYTAVTFRFKMTDGTYGYYGLVKGQFSLPSPDLATQADKNEAQTDTIEGNFVDRNSVMYYIGIEDQEGFDKEQFMAMVFGYEYTPPSS